MRTRAAAATVAWTATLALLCACATPPPPKPAQPMRGDLGYVRAYTTWHVRERMAATGAVAVSVALVVGDDVVWAEGFGRGPLAGAVSADSVYGVGSLSKLVTCLLAKQLAEEGKLDIDAPLAQALPAFGVRTRFPDAPPPTPRSVMTHHSGLPSDILRGMYGPADALDFTAYATRMHDEHVATPPWTVFSYSNAAYAVLGHAVQHAAEQPFAVRAHERLFAPLGMTHTAFDPTSDVARAKVPPFLGGARFAEHVPVTTPANGLFSSANDLARLAIALMRGGVAPDGARVLAQESVDDVFRVQNEHVELDAGFREGLGLNIGPPLTPDSGPVLQHSGQTISYAAELMMLPERRLAVVVLTNTNEALFLPSAVARDALAHLLEATTGVAVPPRPVPRAKSHAFTPAELREMAGDYATDYGLISLAAHDDGLRGRAFEEVLDLVATEKRTFVPWVLGLGVLPVQPEILQGLELTVERLGTETALVSTRYGTRMLRGVRVEALPIAPAWRRRVGLWDNTDAGDDHITITRAEVAVVPGVRGGELLLLKLTLSRMPRPLVVVLDGRDERFALTRGYGRSLGETIRVEGQGDDERLLVSGYTLRPHR